MAPLEPADYGLYCVHLQSVQAPAPINSPHSFEETRKIVPEQVDSQSGLGKRVRFCSGYAGSP